MKKKCIRCREFKDEKEFCEFIATTKNGKVKQRRNTCYECNYKRQIVRSFRWNKATKQQMIEQLKKRFNKYVIKQDGCWDWKGFIRPDGYARMRIGFHTGKKSVGAHVVSWMIHKKILKFDNFMSDGFYILHKCNNRKCCNPKHLYLGNSQDNMIDMVKSGRCKNTQLTIRQVRDIKKMLVDGVKIKDIANKYKVNLTTIRDIKNNKTWKYIMVDSSKLTMIEVQEIKKMLKDGITAREIAKQYNVHEATIGDIKNNKTWKYI